MNWTRSSSRSRTRTSLDARREDFYASMSPLPSSPAHSRDSSAVSTTSVGFSSSGHRRHPSSSSSISSIPESTSTAPTSRTTLDDLVEDPAERDEYDLSSNTLHRDEPFCICDTPFCEHRQTSTTRSIAAMLTPPEWVPGDDYFSDGELSGGPHTKRRRSGEVAMTTFASRLSRRLPSIKKRLSGHRSTASVSNASDFSQNEPPSRTSSLRLPKTRPLTLPALPVTQTPRASMSPTDGSSPIHSISPSRSRASSQTLVQPIDIEMPVLPEEPVDRDELSSTPLLPPLVTEYFQESSKTITSPLQSPTVASSTAVSRINSPTGTPVLPGFPTPPLSKRPSVQSLQNARAAQISNALNEIPTLEEDEDPWAAKLGHANFKISPEPYVPKVCDAQSCLRLQDDFNAAGMEYMKHANRVREVYGQTSETYKLTQEKWKEVDEQWRQVLAQANSTAEALGTAPVSQESPETMALQSLMDKQDVGKAMEVEAKPSNERRSIRKPAFFQNLFSSPSSFLSGRSTFNR